ncbi:MAG: hypothetical protein NZ534_11265, partial [Bacteroidia bacterium]|nr:hypothetical protein [Bacteroidia bacterium]
MLSSWLEYMRRARGLRRIHSPFVYEFARNALFGTMRPSPEIEKLRRALARDKRRIVFDDYGAGMGARGPGRVEATVSELARRAARRPATGTLLWRIVRYFAPREVLEL